MLEQGERDLPSPLGFHLSFEVLVAYLLLKKWILNTKLIRFFKTLL